MGFFEAIINIVTQLLCKDQKPSKPEQSYQQQQHQQQHQQQLYQQPQQYQQPSAQYPPSTGQPSYAQASQGQKPPHSPPHKPSHQQHQQQYGQQQQQQQHHYSPPPSQHAGGKPHRPIQQRIDENQVNQHNPHYLDLRKRANQAGDAMGQCFEQSKRAYEGGDGARAKQLSEEGKKHKAEMEALNKEASDWIFYANNTDSAANEVDLHGLYVKEAISRTEQAVQAAQQRGDENIHLIVGKGMHSAGGVAKLKPAIEELMVKYQLAAQLDPNNSGVLIVQLNSNRRGERGMDAGEIQRRLERDDEACIIM